LLVLPLVRCISPASAFRHRRQSGTDGHGLIRQCPALSKFELEFRRRKQNKNRNSDFDIETKIKILISMSNV
jgi:hypothetical protein